MPTPLTEYRIFVGSPSGLKGERQCFRKRVTAYNEKEAEPGGVIFWPVGWEDTPSGIASRSQERINEDLRKCDYAIFLLHTRYGSPTGTHSSGTVEELELAKELYGQHKLLNIALFRKEVSREQRVDPGPQLQLVEDLLRTEGKGIFYKTFRSMSELSDLIDKQLGHWLRYHEGTAKDTSSTRLVDTAGIRPAPTDPNFDYWISEAEALLEFEGARAQDPESARVFADRARATADTDIKWARASYSLGAASFHLNRFRAAIGVFEQISERLKHQQERDGVVWRAKALVGRGQTLDQIGRSDEAMALYDEVCRDLVSAKRPDEREQFARALIAKARSLGASGKGEDAIRIYDEVVQLFGTSHEPRLQPHVARAHVNKAVWLGRLGNTEEDLKICDQVDALYGKDAQLPLQEQVVRALVEKAKCLLNQNRAADALAVIDKLESRFANARERSVQQYVALALPVRQSALNSLGRPE